MVRKGESETCNTSGKLGVWFRVEGFSSMHKALGSIPSAEREERSGRGLETRRQPRGAGTSVRRL